MADDSERDGVADSATTAADSRAGGAMKRDLAGELVPVEQVVSLAREEATISKRLVETGLVRVSTLTEAFEHIERASLGQEKVEVEHHPVNAWVDAMPSVREEGEVTIVPLVEERLVVEKRLFVREEVHIRRVRATETVEVPVTLRRQQAVVERLARHADAGDDPANDHKAFNQ